MYKRYQQIETISQTLKQLQQLSDSEPCYANSCAKIREQLETAIAFETGQDCSMSKYSTFFQDHSINETSTL